MSQSIKMEIWMIGIVALFAAGSISAAIITDGLVLNVNGQNVVESGGQVTKLVDQSANETDISHNAASGDTYGATLNSGALSTYDTLTIASRGFRLGPTDAVDLNVTADGLSVFLVASLPHDATNRILKKQGGSSMTRDIT